MRKYIHADLTRIWTKKSRIIIAFLFFILYEWGMRPAEGPQTPVAMLTGITSVMAYLPVIIGLFELFVVFGDDFKGKTAQIAIGIGISRKKVVLAKWLEMIIIYTVDLTVLTIVNLMILALYGIVFPTNLLAELIITFLVSVLTLAAYVAIVLPVLFASQGTTLSVILFLVTASTGLARLIKWVGSLPSLQKWHFYSYTLDNCLNIFRTRTILGTFNITSVIGILLYIVIGVVLAMVIYERVELEF